MKILVSFLFLGLLWLTFNPGAAQAADCGLPPGNPPSVPDGATANEDQIKVAIRAVQDYGTEVQNYLNCMQLKKDAFFLNMSNDQRERWNDDYNALADVLTETETRLNEEIRIFNRRS